MSDELELETLKTLAREMDIDFHPSIGLDNLKARIAEADNELNDPTSEADVVIEPQTIAQMKDEALKLRRVTITSMDPSKREYEGEIFQCGNKLTGTIKKYVHFNVPWHIPEIIYNQIKNAKYQTFIKKKVMSSSGQMQEMKEGKLVPAFAVQDMPDLTESEITKLSQRQAMAAGTTQGLS